MADFLFEIGLEEVPARMLQSAEAELLRRVTGLLRRERLLGMEESSPAESFATPRRLAVLVRGLRERQDDATDEVMGPSAKIAFKDGLLTPAGTAFAKKAGVAAESLERVETPKGEYVRARVTRPGRSAAEVLEAELPAELAAIYWAKTMRWRPGKTDRFVRPVRWLLALMDGEVVPVAFAGKQSGRVTYGHRVLYGDAPIEMGRATEYVATMERVFVAPQTEVRRQRIRKALDRECRTIADGRWREDHDLVETVTQLTEWPTVLQGSFPAEFLGLAEEVLVTVMRDHQKYFAVEGSDGRLLPNFLTVLNTEVDPSGAAVIRHGNERVLRARFNDARFFWEFDQRMTLSGRVGLLEKVTFQRDLGSYAAKTERVRGVCAALAAVVTGRGGEVDALRLDRAAELAKTDLTTELVKEFTELQGVVGGLYARAQGEPEDVAQAIYDQYRPAGMEDAVPRTTTGALLAIADKTDTVAGMFGLGMEPTGSKDPFALRRAANGIVKILGEVNLPLTLTDVAEAAAGKGELGERVLRFLRERLEFYLREARGQAYDVVSAVLAASADDVQDAAARGEAISAVRTDAGGGSGDFEAVSAAFKRMRNILTQAAEKGLAVPAAVDGSLLLEGEEVALAERSADLAREVDGLRAERNYRGALEAVASLRPQVDAFFEAVMVMVPEEQVRANRLALLSRVLRDFSQIADFSEIVSAR